jgi:hypothetical protein
MYRVPGCLQLLQTLYANKVAVYYNGEAVLDLLRHRLDTYHAMRC